MACVLDGQMDGEILAFYFIFVDLHIWLLKHKILPGVIQNNCMENPSYLCFFLGNATFVLISAPYIDFPLKTPTN